MRIILAFVSISAVFLLQGCGKEKEATAAANPPPPAVSVVTITEENVPIFSEYTAQTFARDMVEIRGRVDGYVEKRLFQVGSEVQAGQPLYVLDLRPYQANVENARGALAKAQADEEFARKQVALIQAEADLAQAQANLLKAQQDVKRLQPLVKEDAASQQDLDNALAALQANEAAVKARQANVEQNRVSTKTQIDAAKAQVESARANLRSAELDLEYATIKAPITGRIGDTLVQVGGLVSRSSPTPLTTIVPLNPIWVRFKVSEAEYLAFEKKFHKPMGQIPLELVLADGTTLPQPGTIQNSVNQVDQKTGTLEIQATFPNPKKFILPGQFGRVRVRVDDRKNAILIPQRAVTEMQGLQSVFTVGPDNKVRARSISTGERVGDRWIILQGLKPGERIIVEGLQKARPGAIVKPEPYQQPSAKAAASEQKGS